MTLADQLRTLVEAVSGATACTLMGFDGIAVQGYEIGGSALNISALLTEYAAAFQTLRHGGEQQPLGGTLRELTLNTTHLCTVVQLLNDDYFVAMVLEPKGLSGKARFVLRQAAPALLKELG